MHTMFERCRAKRADEGGFTLVEVLVALGILMVVAAALAPLLIISMRASNTAKYNTQAKSLAQQQIEAMRNLPFHVAQSAGPYVDLLDIYFRNLSTAAAGNSRCTSAYYTTATAGYTCKPVATDAKFALYTVSVTSQFLNPTTRAVVVPQVGYDSQVSTGDVPPSTLLGVSIKVSWTAYGSAKSFSTFTQITNSESGLPQTLSKFRDTAVSVDSTLDDVAPYTKHRFDGGSVNGDTGLSDGATASGTAVSATSTFSSGEVSTNSASGSVSAPVDQTTFSTVTGSAAAGPPCTTGYSCFGPSSVSNVTGKASGGLPSLGSAAAPLTASLQNTGSSPERGFRYTNVPTTATQQPLWRLNVQPLAPSGSPTWLVKSTTSAPSTGFSIGCGGPFTAQALNEFVTATGYADTTGGSAHSVTSCVTANTRRVDVLPTLSGGTQNGVVQVTLNYASLKCSATGTAASATPLYSATVSYWNQALNAGSGAYVVVPISNAQASDPLTSTLLNKGAGGVVVGTGADGSTLWLGDYISSWSSGSFNGGAQSGNTVGQGDLSVVSLSTAPTRTGDLDGHSKVNVAVGQLSCTAEDNR